MIHPTNDVRHGTRPDHAELRDAVRFAALVAALALAFLVVATVWVGTCSGSTVDTVACGVPQRTLLALGAPTILFVGGVRAFFRTYRTWRTNDAWWAWQGAGWFLFTAMLIVLVMSLPPLVGPGLG